MTMMLACFCCVNLEAGMEDACVAAVVVGAAAALAWRYRQLREEARLGVSARVVMCPPSKPNLTPSQLRLAAHVSAIVGSCPSLSSPSYTPPVLASGTWTNLALLMLKQRLFRCEYRRQVLQCEDGGVVTVDL